MSAEKKIEFGLTCWEVWSVSTGHIPQEDTNCISDADIHAVEYPEGWWITVPAGDEVLDKLSEVLSPALINLFRIAENRGIRWINLDADGQEYDWLPKYQW